MRRSWPIPEAESGEAPLKIEVRFRQLLERLRLLDPWGRPLHGLEAQLEEEAEVGKAETHKLLACPGKDVKISTLEKLCTRLWPMAEKAGLSQEEVVKLLFGAQQSDLLTQLARHGRIQIFMGVWQQGRDQWVSPNDAEAHTAIVSGLLELHHLSPKIDTQYIRFRLPLTPDGYMDPAYRSTLQGDQQDAQGLWHRLCPPAKSKEAQADRTPWILLGSQRSLYLVECLVADLFGVERFVLSDRQVVPFFMRCDTNHHNVPSCFGGLNVPRWPKPGLYYRQGIGDNAKPARLRGWRCIPRTEDTDAGIVIVQMAPSTRLEGIAVFGFTGKSTKALAGMFSRKQELERFLPLAAPAEAANGRTVGIYVCEFSGLANGGPVLARVEPIPKVVIEASRQPRHKVWNVKRGEQTINMYNAYLSDRTWYA